MRRFWFRLFLCRRRRVHMTFWNFNCLAIEILIAHDLKSSAKSFVSEVFRQKATKFFHVLDKLTFRQQHSTKKKKRSTQEDVECMYSNSGEDFMIYLLCDNCTSSMSSTLHCRREPFQREKDNGNVVLCGTAKISPVATQKTRNKLECRRRTKSSRTWVMIERKSLQHFRLFFNFFYSLLEIIYFPSPHHVIFEFLWLP